MRRLTFLPLVPLVLGACAPEPAGPAAPIAREQVLPGPALDASAARRAAVEFVQAYADSPREGVDALSRSVAGDELTTWVRWLGVQHREFTGGIRAVADIRDVEFVTTIEGGEATGAQIGLSASISFEFSPEGDDPFQVARLLDGPVTLVRTATGAYRVLDLFRDGVPMSDGIQLLRSELREEGDLTVVLDSLFMFPPNWQFNVVVENHGEDAAFLDPNGVALFVRQGGGFERIDGVVTESLALVPPGGAVDGILAYPAQELAEGRVLSIVYTEGRDVVRFEFPLDDLVNVVPPPPPTGEAPAVEVAG